MAMMEDRYVEYVVNLLDDPDAAECSARLGTSEFGGCKWMHRVVIVVTHV